MNTSSLSPILENTAARNRVSSAYILTGSDTGLLSQQARLFTKRLNCRQQKICDTCTDCQKIDRGVHPDVRLIESHGEIINIETLREIRNKLYLKPYEGRCKVIIIDGAQHLQHAAGNSILKILEEPPPQTVFLLLTPHWEQLLSTIISRCHIVRLGSVNYHLPQTEHLDTLLNIPQSREKLFALAKTISEEDETFENCLEIWLAWYHALLLYHEDPALKDDLFDAYAEQIKKLARRYDRQKLCDKIDAVLETKKNLRFQMNRQLLAENLLLTLGGC